MKRLFYISTVSMILVSYLMVMGGCSGSGKGGSEGSGSGTTVVSGKVTLSSSILSKPGLLLAQKQSLSLLGGALDKTSGISAMKTLQSGVNEKLNTAFYASTFSGATVDMYDADHPGWLFPIATGTTASDGSYTLSNMTNAAKNSDAKYSDGDSIPAGNYTLVAYSGFGLGQKPIVAVQTIVKNFDGAIPNVDFEILPSDVSPTVSYMFGASKSTDGTEIWGGANTILPANAAIQLTFSMPMWRDNISSGISIDPPVLGKWSLSADWLTATFYLDPGIQMVPGQVYTVTVRGDDSDPALARATNVYGNPVKNTATGTFKAGAADSISPTVQWNSPTVIEMGELVDVTQAFRIESNEMLDVNGISLRGSPSIGVKPGVLFLGKNASGLYVYEFMLGEPLILDTSYSLTVSGGKDLSGHVMNTLTGSIRTNDAAHTPGIDPLASIEVQNMQAQVKSVFGRWVRAMNDRNLAQWQNVMSGEFYLEYDSSRGISGSTDLNRDGRFSLGEFSEMLYRQAFPQWDYCGSTISGTISPAVGDSINVVPLTMTSDFEFKLNAVSKLNAPMCTQASPRDSFYATVKYKNGSWKIVRASEGIDTRDKSINKPSLITAKLYQETWPLWIDAEIIDGGIMTRTPNGTDLNAIISWDAAPGVTSYVLIISDERDPSTGMAIALSNNITSVSTDPAKDIFADTSANALDVSRKFGFYRTDHTTFQFQTGGRYYWEVVGFGTATSKADPTNPNDPNFVSNKSMGDLIKDIAATSKLKRFVIGGGIYSELTVEVRAGSSTTTTPVKYNPGFSGYDVGSAYQATITIYTQSTASTGSLSVYGSENKTYNFTFTNRQATVTISLFNGFNSVNINETAPGLPSLYKYFNILTVGGKPPVIGIWEVKDDLGNTLSGDMWRYYATGSGAKAVYVSGAVSDTSVNNLSLYVYNEFGPQYQISSLPTSSITGDNIFTAMTVTIPLEIYKGMNYISFNASGSGKSYSTDMTVYSDTGSLWIPPIKITGITGTNSTATKIADYTTSSDWNAVLGGGSNSIVTITGQFKNVGNGRYNTWSDGGYSNGTLVSDGSGNFSLDVLLYNGWNYVSLSDTTGNNWYNANIFTSTGKPVIKPTITTIDGSAYNGSGTYSSSLCSAVITGTSEPGDMRIDWQGSDGVSSYSESMNFPNSSGTFAFTVPLVSGSGSSNVVTIYDANYRRGNVTIATSGSCPYTPPTSALTTVKDSSGTVLAPSGNNYSAAASPTITLVGTTNRPGGMVTARLNVCGQYENYATTADGAGNWTISGIKVYGSIGNAWVYINAPGYSGNVNVTSTANGQTFTPRLQITNAYVAGTTTPITLQPGGGCGYTNWDAGTATAIDIVGTSTYLNGTGNYTDTINRTFPFAISGTGNFSLSGVPVWQGTGNNININVYNDPAGQVYHNMNITSTNGITKPQFVTITYPSHGQTGITGVKTVVGTITDPMGSGFSPTSCNAYVYSQQAGAYTYYSTQSYTGYLPMTCGSGSFSIPGVDFGTGTQSTYVQVYAYDNNLGQSHYDRIYVNATGYTHTWSKPGAAIQSVDPEMERLFGEFTNRFLIDIQR